MNAVVGNHNLFENSKEFPDSIAMDRLNRLVGLENYKNRLSTMLSLLVDPGRLNEWAKKFHKCDVEDLGGILNRPPLVVLAGDVGSGKTELAETICDKVARDNRLDITMLPLSLSSRGQGRVGEMTQLVSAAFQHTLQTAKRLKGSNGRARGAVVLLIDEADALAQTRESEQMHHEDRAGVNALIRGIDTLAAAQLPAAVIMCTNRLDALDPAVKRRAAEILTFKRPDRNQRYEFLQKLLGPFALQDAEIRQLVMATGETASRKYGFSYSDIANRLVPALILDAFPSKPVTGSRALQIVNEIVPTPPFNERK